MAGINKLTVKEIQAVGPGEKPIKLFDGALTIAPWSDPEPGSVEVLARSIAVMRPLEPRMAMAVPCELSDDLLPGATRLRGWEGDGSLVARLLRRVEELGGPGHPWQGRSVEVRLLNDAEMAAESARIQVAPEDRPTLVLTLGFGPGAAVLER